MNDTERYCVASKAAPASSTEGRDCDQGGKQSRNDQLPERNDDPVDRSNESADPPREIGGRKGPDPVRYGDWEKNGRCIDF